MNNDNIIPMSSKAIDLPVSPYRSTSAEGELLNAPVVATLMSGKTIAGRLSGVDGPRAIITLQAKGASRSYVRFNELRYLHFIARNPINRSKHPLQQVHAGNIIMPRATQEFRISFTDHKVLSGRTRGSFVDKIGIHLFQLVDSAHVSRLFVPSQAVQRYYIGQRRDTRRGLSNGAEQGDDMQLHRHSVASQQTPPRRRKSDHPANNKSAAADDQALRQALAARDDGSEGLAGAKRIGEMLVEDGIISQQQLDAALENQRSDGGQRIGEILVKTGAASAEQIYTALAHKFGLPFVLLRNFFIDIECLGLIPADVVRKYTLLPLALHDDRLVIAMDDPANTEALTLLRFMTHFRIEPTIATREDIEWAIGKYYGAAPRPTPQTASTSATDEADPGSREERNRQTTEKAVVSFISNTIADAIDRNAADIHIVGERNHVDLLFRINGSLVSVRRFSRVIMPAVLQHLSVMGRIEANENQALQHGRARMLSDDAVIDAHILIDRRKAVETAIIRLSRTGAALTPLDRLGLEADSAARLQDVLIRQGGLVIVGGPAEAHRSGTLYSALREMHRQGRAVATAEAPVSYYMSGTEQLHPQTGDQAFKQHALDGARNRNIEGMLIGELDDAPTLRSAVTSANQGVAVLAKVRAATAAQAISRLMELAEDRTALGTALGAVLAQHAVQVNCRYCLQEEKVSPADRAALGVDTEEVFYHGAGCEDCHGTGYDGSQPLFELLAVSPEIRTLIESGATSAEIHRRAVTHGMVTLAEGALLLARLRRIPFAEAQRLFRQTQNG